MATDKPRFSITIPDNMLAQVEKYQSDRKISTKSKAIQRLIDIGLEGEAEDYETEAWEIARSYRAKRSQEVQRRKLEKTVLLPYPQR